MKTRFTLMTLAALLFSFASAQDGFRPLFNGKDLEGWEGNPELWSVKDGAIVGRTQDPKQLSYNQFLTWRGGTLKNFELKLKAKVTGNNSGIQYRSKENEGKQWSIRGYQCDMHPAVNYSGMLYEEGGRGIVAQNGQTVVIDPEGKRWLTETREPVKADPAEWREYTIIARGNHVIHQIDGQVTMELFDHEEGKRSLEGLLAFQLHSGPAMEAQFKDVMLKELPDGGVIAFDKAKLPEGTRPVESSKPAAKGKAKAKGGNGKGSPSAQSPPKSDGLRWIWGDGPGFDSAARLKKEFDLNVGEIKEATLFVSCDNGAKVFLNGELVLTNPDWMNPSRENVKKFLKPGKNELRAEATNKGGVAAFVAVLVVKTEDGKEQIVQSDASWQAALAKTEDWKAAKVMGNYGAGPWGAVFEGGGSQGGAAETIAADKISVPEGFVVEKLYNVPKDTEGSWVALAVDPKGRLIAGDQYGALYRMTVPPIGSDAELEPERLPVEIGKAHGLLYAFDSLYVMVNEDGARNGLYRVTDSNGDDQYDQITLLHSIKGGGEHGLHSMVVSPDGKRIFFNCGNSSKLPETLERSRGAKNWDEDHILPRLWDGNGFMRGATGPGGYVCSMNPDGSDLELFCYGFRNQFDICFDLGGQLFTFDADMEWDIGAPWYRPTRVNHCVSGGNYGWHAGSGKWPDYYPDNLPTTIDIGPGSPTGVVGGQGAKFPARYQRAIFINDWTFGTMWAIHLEPSGGSYTAKKEEFVFGKPLPLTDLVIHPGDGAMYFAVGGRRTQSGLYRVSYTGAETTNPVEALPLGEVFTLRAELEALHAEGSDAEKVLAKAWPMLGHDDRHIRYAARIAIERLPVESWREKVFSETRPHAVVEAVIALSRAEGKVSAVENWPHATTSSPSVGPVLVENMELQNRLWQLLDGINFAKLTVDQQLGTLRAAQLVYTRFGKPQEDACAQVAERLEALYPAADPYVNRELAQLLVAVDSKRVVSETLALMATASDDFQEVASDAVLSRNDGYANAARAAAGSRPNAQQISYMMTLRNASAGWNSELRRTYFSWFPRARAWKGGNSFKNFIENIRKEALANIAPEVERADLDSISSRDEAQGFANFVPPKGPGRIYSLDEAVNLAEGNLTGRNFVNGKNMYQSVLCGTCHRFNGEGGSIGPDLTGSGNRYTLRDLLENIIDPSKVISDQYDSHQITKKDGSVLVGRIVVEENGMVFMMINPFSPNDQVAISESDIASKESRKISMMPPGLINALNQDELLDLIAFIQSGGDEKNAMFAR